MVIVQNLLCMSFRNNHLPLRKTKPQLCGLLHLTGDQIEIQLELLHGAVRSSWAVQKHVVHRNYCICSECFCQRRSPLLRQVVWMLHLVKSKERWSKVSKSDKPIIFGKDCQNYAAQRWYVVSAFPSCYVRRNQPLRLSFASDYMSGARKLIK